MEIEWRTKEGHGLCGEFFDARGVFTDSEGVRGVVETGEFAGQGLLLLGRYSAPLCLSQSQVSALLPALRHFAETGRLPAVSQEQKGE